MHKVLADQSPSQIDQMHGDQKGQVFFHAIDVPEQEILVVGAVRIATAASTFDGFSLAFGDDSGNGCESGDLEGGTGVGSDGRRRG
jgi:hypothetical protein